MTLFSFTAAWKEYLYAFVFITSEKLMTLPVGLAQTIFGDIYPWGMLMAAVAAHLGARGHLLHVGPALHGRRSNGGQCEGITVHEPYGKQQIAVFSGNGN